MFLYSSLLTHLYLGPSGHVILEVFSQILYALLIFHVYFLLSESLLITLVSTLKRA